MLHPTQIFEIYFLRRSEGTDGQGSSSVCGSTGTASLKGRKTRSYRPLLDRWSVYLRLFLPQFPVATYPKDFGLLRVFGGRNESDPY